MKKILILLLLFNSCFAQTWYFKKIDAGSIAYFKVDKIYLNPMSNPYNIFTNIYLPDSSSVTINIVNNKGDTLYSKLFENKAPGKYQFSWYHKRTVEDLPYILDIVAFRNSEKGPIIFSYKTPFILLK
jgi:hypothetical protein